ncbi:MAG: 5-formyltetrahydrofolate cyclo-ligase [Candidatus Micrarchaeota archaeon]
MVQHLKAALRTDMLRKRDSLPAGDVRRMSDAIMVELFSRERFREASIIGFYIPKGNEVDTRPMIERTLAMGKTVAVPYTDHKITFCRFTSFESLKAGKYGILEPDSREPLEPELIVVPGVAFGLCMHRLGYGKGYYDRYLASSFAYRVGVCYDLQVVEKLPSHEDDQRMDEIITEKRIITL